MHEGAQAAHASDKATLRKELRARRVALAPPAGTEEARAAALATAEWLARAVARAPRRVALYLPMGHEFDPAPLGELLQGRGAAVCYPRVAGGAPRRLQFHDLRDPAALRRGPMGVMEPDPGQPVAEDIDLFVVPGLGFDRAGHRLGYGGGYYDHALRALPSALRIAACYPFQLLQAIPYDEQDEPVDLIVTPAGVHRTGARPLPANTLKEDEQWTLP